MRGRGERERKKREGDGAELSTWAQAATMHSSRGPWGLLVAEFPEESDSEPLLPGGGFPEPDVGELLPPWRCED